MARLVGDPDQSPRAGGERADVRDHWCRRRVLAGCSPAGWTDRTAGPDRPPGARGCRRSGDDSAVSGCPDSVVPGS
jgi:hypothetical protein